jgi:autotransporter-associated beta strand protein
MNTNRSALLHVALRTLAASALPVAASAQDIISINLGANEPNGSINTGSALTAGALPVAGTFWNNMSGATQTTPQALVNNVGGASGASVTWSSANTWRSGSPGGTATSQNGNLTKGYLDDGNGGPLITITNVPFLAYNAYVIVGGDQGSNAANSQNYRPVTVNGVAYSHDDTATVASTANWTGAAWGNADNLAEGQNYLLAANQSGLTLTVRGGNNSGPRGSISGVQIENAYTGTLRYWDIDDTVAGAGGSSPSGTWDTTTPNWNNAAGDGSASAWTGSNEAAVFSAGTGATGSYTVTVSGTQTADAVILQEGNLTLSGGAIDLVNASVVRSFTTGGTLTIDSDITSLAGVSFDGAGSHVLNGNAAYPGGTNISSPFNLSATGEITGTSSVNVNGVTAIVDGTLSATGAINLNSASILGEGTIVAGGNVNLNNLGVENNLTLAGAGSITASAGSLLINRGSVTLNGNATASVRNLFNTTGGITATLNVNDSASLTVSEFMTLGDNTGAAMVVNQAGGNVTNNGTFNNPGGNSMSNRWGHWGGSATTTYNLSGGSLNLTAAPLYLSWDSAATLNISGTGVANLRGVNMGFGTRVNASTINLNAGGTLNVGSDGIITGGLTNKVVNLNGGTLGALADWTGSVPMVLGANTVVDTTGGDISLAAAITGAGDLTLQGGGTVVLGGVNTFTGATTVTGNTTLLFGLLGGHGPAVTVEPGSTIGAGNLNVAGTGVAGNIVAQNGSSSVFRISSGTSDLLDVLDLNIDTTHTLTVVPTGVIAANTVIPVIDYATLSGAGYAGVNVVSGNPRLAVSKEPDDGSTISIKVNSFDSVVWKGSDGTNPGLWDIDTTTNWQTDSTLVATKFLQNDVVIFNDTATTNNVTLAGAIAPASVLFNHSTLNYSLAGSGIGGNGSLTKDGTGTLELRNDNSYLGNTIVTEGLLRIGDGTSGSITNGTVQVDGGNVEVNMAAGATYTRPTTLALGTQLSFTGSGDLNTNGALSGDGNLLVNRAGTVLHNGAGNLLLGTVTVNNGTLAVDGAQQANRFRANQLITVNSGATFEYRGVNATPTALNSIDPAVTSGTLRVVSGASALATDSHGHMRNITLDASTMELNYSGTGTAYNGESIQLNGGFNVVGTSPSVINTGVGGDATNTGIALVGAGNTFTIADVTGSPAADLTVNAEIEANDGGTGALVKAGAGTMALNNACSYTGTTTVQEGTLLVNSTLASSGITVNTGATVGGTGSTAGTLTVSAGGTVAPGAGAGDLAVGTTVINGSYACEIDGLNADTLVVTGNLDLTGSTLALSVLGGGATEASYLIASYTGTLTGTFAVTGLPSGYAVNYDTAGEIRLVGGSDAYGDWETLNGIAGAGADTDSDNDGIPNGIEFVIGGDPSGPGSDSSALLPTITTDATYLNFTFRRSDDSTSYGPFVEYGSNLTGWTEAEAGVNGVVINEIDNGFGAGIDSVEVKIPRALAVGARLFSRLKVTIP